VVRAHRTDGADVAVEHAAPRGNPNGSDEVVRPAWIPHGGPFDRGVVIPLAANRAIVKPRSTLPIHLSVISALFLAGCKVGPNYKRPDVALQSRWTTSASTELSVVYDASPPPAWWTTLDDPTLNSLVQRACRGNLSVSIAKSRIQGARAQRSVAAGGLLPSAGASGSFTFNRAHGPLSPVNTGDYQFYTAGFDAIWEADMFGGVRRSVEAAEADLQAQQDARRGVLVSLVAEVSRNYVELRTAQKRLIIAKTNIQTQNESLDVARRLNAAGIVSDLDVTRAQAELTQSQSDVPALEIRERTGIHQLGILLGEAPLALVTELQAVGPIPAPARRVPIGLPSELLRRRPDVRQVERQLAAATARIGVAEADLYPKLTLTGNVGFGAEQPGSVFNWSNRYVSVGPGVRWELFQGGRILANIEAHKAIRQEMLDQYRLTILTALREVEDALTAFNRRQQQFNLLSKSVESSRESVRIASERYAGGAIDYLSLLDAQRALLKAEDAMVTSQGEITLNVIALYKAIGGGWEHIEGKIERARSPRGDFNPSSAQGE
jgi:NodT family efflux transporter outer membrane factor (OMF) lipoprotein